MDVDELIRTRRTHKAFEPAPVDRATLDELLDLARWAPNHHLTNPWRFRVLGPKALAALKQAAGPEAAPKLDRAPTLIAVSAIENAEDPIEAAEDYAATASAAYIVLLAAHARGLAGYWRTPGVLRTEAGRAACGIPEDERFVALIHLGRGKGPDKPPPARLPLDEVRTFLD